MRKLYQTKALLHWVLPVGMILTGCTKTEAPPANSSAGANTETMGSLDGASPETPAAPGGAAGGSGAGSKAAPAPSAGVGSPPDSARPVAPAPRPAPVTVAEGTEIKARLVPTLSTKTAQAGQAFEATLAEPLIAGDYVIAPKGARVSGTVVESDPGGRVKGVASIAVKLTGIEVKGKEIAISTTAYGREAQSTKKQDAAKVGIASGIGAAVGAIAGGGRGAAIGAGAGAGAGTGVVLATRGEPAVLPSETMLTVKLTAPLTVER